MRFICALVFAASLSAQPVADVVHSLEEISGLKALKPVPQERIRRDQLKAFFEKRMKEAVKPEETARTELALKMLGLVPSDFHLEQTMVDLLSEQAAAFYDYQHGKMVMLEGSSGPLEQMALVHELAHALADQHFKIDHFLRMKGGDEDEAGLARQAVVEGQAQWLMSEYMARQLGQSLLKSPALADMLAGATDASGQFPVYDKAPLYLRESLVFPYAAGMKFQQAVLSELGNEGFRRIFEHPPVNSHEVIHPELYLHPQAGVTAAAIMAPDLAHEPGRHWKLIAPGTLGEFDQQVLLKLYASEAMPVAADWRAGEYRLWRNKKTGATAMTVATLWATPEAAHRYFQAYRKVIEGKWPDARVATEAISQAATQAATQATLRGEAATGEFEVHWQGTRVTSREGLPKGTLGIH